MVPADKVGNKLFLKDLREEKDRLYVKYKSTYNNIPFRESELYPADGGTSFVITGDDGTVIWRIPALMIKKIIN